MSEKKKKCDQKPSQKEHKFPKPDECAICTESMKDVTNPMACGHWFHVTCVKKQFKPKCAICRAILPIAVNGKRPNNSLYQRGFEDGVHHGIRLLARAGRLLDDPDGPQWDPVDYPDDASVYSIPAYGRQYIRAFDPTEHDSRCNEDYCFCDDGTDSDPGTDEENPHGDSWCYEYV
jgi:hypothetical protein